MPNRTPRGGTFPKQAINLRTSTKPFIKAGFVLHTIAENMEG
jgi:hypothetical protein